MNNRVVSESRVIADHMSSNPVTVSISKSQLEGLSSCGESIRPKTISDNYDLVGVANSIPNFKPPITPREKLELPIRGKRKMVRKTKSSNAPHMSRITSNDNRSASWRNYTPVSLNCPNLTNLKDYQISVLIGQGAFGVVKRGTRKSDNQKVAIKQYDKSKLCQDESRVAALKAEIATLHHLDHPGIMKFYDAIDSGNKISIVVEYINGNNLFQYLRKLHG